MTGVKEDKKPTEQGLKVKEQFELVRTKSSKRVHSEREPRESERDHDSGRGRRSKRDEVEPREKKRTENDEGRGRSSSKTERRTENHDDDGGGRSHKRSHSRHERSPERNGRGRHSSQSPPRSRHRSRSPPHHHASPANAKPRDEMMNSRGDEQMDDEDESIRKMKAAEEALEEKQKQKPSFELSGKLAAETNRVRGVTLLFNEPPEARKPDIKWRLYVFKAGEVLNEPLYIHRQSCYLFGRERRVADIPTDHPSCSKQHAVIQFRQVEKEQPDGMLLKQIRPYIMDLGSTNKTFINDSPIEPHRYYELREKDTIKFGNSSREYVLLHENSIG
ncbi:FHA domain-containing protein DDL [Cajanus cajan]|uniref:FHA domain-containing protein DDL n=1 Tax=Cajanus cajan TaxID=3821 RepID=UPI00098D903F|nr:FHA domain-containing protein DDL [Cajanus cajan]